MIGSAEDRYTHRCYGCHECLPPCCANCGADLTEDEVEARKTEPRDDCYRCADPETVETRTLSDAELLAAVCR